MRAGLPFLRRLEKDLSKQKKKYFITIVQLHNPDLFSRFGMEPYK